jgi:hypothetical protein
VTSRALVGLALLAGLVTAQTPDTLKPQLNPADSTAQAESFPTYRPARSTGTAVLLSLLLPGGGQVYTGNWWKAALIAPAEVTLGYLSFKHVTEKDSASYARHRDTRAALLWWTGAVVAFSMADAYVSARMYGFDREMRLTLGPTRAGIAMGL